MFYPWMQTANILDAEAVLFIVCFLAIQFHPSRIILYLFSKNPKAWKGGNVEKWTLEWGAWDACGLMPPHASKGPKQTLSKFSTYIKDR